jgi:molecular chaperone DnaK
MGHVIGIDLGTTNCCVAVVEHGAPQVIKNRMGYPTTPSIVAITEAGKRIVGQIAARQAITNPRHTVYASKRLIGRKFDSPEVKHAIEHMPYSIVEGPHEDVRVELRGRLYSVPELSAMLLQEMRVIAEEELKREVVQAVVTVPAYFNDSQRQAVVDAGKIAGLEVLRIINEPTSAALAYGFRRTQAQRLAIYDLGGGTFDISIVEIEKTGELTVIATTGDSYLGGEDFDGRIVDWIVKTFMEEHQIDLRDSPIALQRLKQAAQKAKCDLSTLDTADIQLPFIVQRGSAGPLNLDYRITRPELEKLTGDLITRTLHICEDAMKLANLGPKAIDEVILVGGMTRMPAIQWAVREYFDKEPNKSVHPDEVVALGAAIQGAALVNDIKNVSLQDVTAHSLGLATAGGLFDVIIPSNTGVPVKVTSEFTTSRDNQDRVNIVVMQGESARSNENELLGHFALMGLRNAPAGEPDIEVTFEINADGIFGVTARDLATGEQQAIEVTASSGLTSDEIDAMKDESANFLSERRTDEKHERVKQEVETLVAEVERLLAKVGEDGAALGAQDLVDSAKEALESGDAVALEEHLKTIGELKSMLRRTTNH